MYITEFSKIKSIRQVSGIVLVLQYPYIKFKQKKNDYKNWTKLQ